MPATLLAFLLGCSAGPPDVAVTESARHEALLPDAERAAVAAGYRERARLGLGSPFRLIDFALHDVRLDSLSRARTAHAILSATAHGNTYRVDPAALATLVSWESGIRLDVGVRHLRFIEETISGASHPRTGALAVRFAYSLARLEGTLDGFSASTAIQVAALVRDRELARRDALRLLAAASSEVDAVRLVPEWRRTGRFRVERTLGFGRPCSAEADALRQAPVLLQRIRVIGSDLAHSRSAVGRSSPALQITPEVARGLERAAQRLSLPPRSGVITAVYFARKSYRIDESQRWQSAWRELEAGATDEERLLAATRRALERAPSLRPAVALLLVRTAVELRPYAQEAPWFPGMGGPSPVELSQRHGITLGFGPQVPPSWHPFYRRVLAESLADLETVFPRLGLHGLRIEVPLRSDILGALASHTPHPRVLVWPAMTGPGSLAHEIAHDLDWQAAQRSGLGVGYASEVAVAERRTPLGRALLDLVPEARARVRGARRYTTEHTRRPSEILARSFEWLALTELDRRGIANGYLSSAQDEFLTGHGSLRPPGEGLEYGTAVLRAVGAVLPVPPEAEEHFREAYGSGRTPRPHAILRTLAQAHLALGPPADVLGFAPDVRRVVLPLRRARDRALSMVDEWLCRSTPLFPGRELVEAYREFITIAAAARGRGLLLERLRAEGDRTGIALALREFYGPGWPLATSGEPLPRWKHDLAREIRALDAWTPTGRFSDAARPLRPGTCGRIGPGSALDPAFADTRVDCCAALPGSRFDMRGFYLSRR